MRKFDWISSLKHSKYFLVSSQINYIFQEIDMC
jgi:hypothetical protein